MVVTCVERTANYLVHGCVGCWAFTSYSSLSNNCHNSLKHVIKFPVWCIAVKASGNEVVYLIFLFTSIGLFVSFFLQCHQKPSGNQCGFYVIDHITKAIELPGVKGEPEVYTYTLNLTCIYNLKFEI